MSRTLTKTGIARAAQRIGCTTAALRAVLAVETNGFGFLSDGRPSILFERHHFHRLTNGRFDGVNPDVSNPVAGGYKVPTGEWMRLYAAAQLDADAAVQSASWGIGQIMGFNWPRTGEKSLMGFLLAMHNNEDAQLQLVAEFMLQSGAAVPLALPTPDWRAFARIYNGPNYARNKYDERLAKAHARVQGEAA